MISQPLHTRGTCYSFGFCVRWCFCDDLWCGWFFVAETFASIWRQKLGVHRRSFERMEMINVLCASRWIRLKIKRFLCKNWNHQYPSGSLASCRVKFVLTFRQPNFPFRMTNDFCLVKRIRFCAGNHCSLMSIRSNNHLLWLWDRCVCCVASGKWFLFPNRIDGSSHKHVSKFITNDKLLRKIYFCQLCSLVMWMSFTISSCVKQNKLTFDIQCRPWII